MLRFAPFGDAPTIDWNALFGNPNPVEIEIGCGKGAFLVDYARSLPDRNFLGIDWQRRWIRRLEERLDEAAILNAKALHADASLVVERFVPDESVRAYHLYFPDPWWKKRHHKRRIVRGSLVANLHRTLEPGGRLFLATDVPSRCDEMLAELRQAPFVIHEGEDALPSGRPFTNYERKYRAEGRPLRFAVLERRE